MVTPMQYTPITMLPQQQQQQTPFELYNNNGDNNIMRIMHRQQKLLFGNNDIRLEKWNRTKKLAFSEKVDCVNYSRYQNDGTDSGNSSSNFTITTKSLEDVNDSNKNDDSNSCSANNDDENSNSSIWWKKEELETFKKNAKSLARELRREDKESSSSKICASLIMAQKKTTIMIKSDFKMLLKLPLSRPDEDLFEWCKYSDGRRGLERFICTQDAIRQRNGVIRTRRAVMAAQKKKRTADKMISTCNFEEEIAESSRQVTRRSRTLAHFMGAADARVANNVHYPQRKRARTTSVVQNNIINNSSITSDKKSQHHHVVATATNDQEPPQRRQATSCAA